MRRSSLLHGSLLICAWLFCAGTWDWAQDGPRRPGGKSASSQTATVSPYRITGVVVSRTGGNPLAHCHLTATRVDQAAGGGMGRMGGFAIAPGQFPARFGGQGQAATDTDAEGRFSLTVPSAGAWRVMATASGYGSSAYEEHEGYSSAVVLTQQTPVYDLKFRLAPEASVTGTVLDEAGEPTRNAQVRLMVIPPPSPDGKPVTMRVRAATTTDDRGVYQFDNLPAGSYKIALDARPWYAAEAQQAQRSTQNGSADSALDPSLDMAYPETWYPGMTDPREAEVLELKAGDSLSADFKLVPLPSIHLQIVMPPQETNGQGQPMPMFPIVQRVSDGAGGMGFVQSQVIRSPQGTFDISGLTPGSYQVRLQGQNPEARTVLVEVTEGGAHMVDFNAPSSEARLVVHLEGEGTEGDNRIQVGLINAETGQRIYAMQNRGGRANEEDTSGERVLEVPPGRYEVVLSGGPDTYFGGMTAKSAPVTGRYVTLSSGTTDLTVRVAHGRVSVSGVAKKSDRPVVGAMVLLVPAGLDDPRSVTLMIRDQTNTDGSFDLPAVIPGQYILVAIEDGWQVNWKDSSTLNRYLIHGVPLDLSPGTKVKQDITVQEP